ncbi:SMP-30/gluconolactonase/LRE family protein [Aminobacter sp. AP02]|uniref:SMP-30/gluconolactonase/LRE family protein n=1 Tax=Aminobacter sp. AP02 TaxID=2135737 RepID=UPI000D6B5256|nr:SMP-30/gluconolactonase/LRE family protein [Aminobacter sp. AP02]PWK73947.1 sugar lactone lactonase YvrE [Aminobacter sp. AP02]
MTLSDRTIAGGFVYPECPRWHDGQLWVADQHDSFVHVLAADGTRSDSFAVPGGPSGMGWLPDGSLLVVSMDDRKLLRRGRDGKLTQHADLSGVHPFHSNDMVVDAQGRAYAGNIGFDFYAGQAPAPTVLAMVTPSGDVGVAADGLMCPNGAVITPDGRTLIIAESMGARLTAFAIGADGSLSNRRIFAGLEGHVPDGICLDAEGHVWAASPYEKAVLRVSPSGEIVERVEIPDANPYACMLGGADGRDLFICVAPHHDPEVTAKLRGGRIDVVRAPAPGAGRP